MLNRFSRLREDISSRFPVNSWPATCATLSRNGGTCRHVCFLGNFKDIESRRSRRDCGTYLSSVYIGFSSSSDEQDWTHWQWVEQEKSTRICAGCSVRLLARKILRSVNSASRLFIFVGDLAARYIRKGGYASGARSVTVSHIPRAQQQKGASPRSMRQHFFSGNGDDDGGAWSVTRHRDQFRFITRRCPCSLIAKRDSR